MKLTANITPSILACVVVSLLFVSQFAPVVRAEILPIKNYSSADGLIYEEVQKIYQDTRGFIWISTPVGISRFDGYQFTSYGFEDGLYNTLMTDMVEDGNGVYWFGTMNGIVYRFDPRANPNTGASAPKRFEDYKIGDDDTYVNSIFKTAGGEIYFATSKGLFTLDDSRTAEKFVPVEIDSEKNNLNFTAMAQDAAGSLWIGYQKGLLRRLPNGEVISYQVEPDAESRDSDLVLALAVDADGRVWTISENRHLFVFNPEPAGELPAADKSRRKFRFDAANKPAAEPAQGFAYQFTAEENPADGSARAICSAASGKIWLTAYKKGLVSFDGREFLLYTKTNGLNNDMLTAVREDSFGNLWIGSEGGAMKFSNRGFVTYNQDSGLSDERILKIFEDRRDGTIYATNPNWTINRYDGRQFEAIKLNIPAPSGSGNLSTKTLLDSRGDWWFATERGLYRYAGITKAEQINSSKPLIYTSAEGLPADSVFSIYEDSRGDIWTSSRQKPDYLTVWNRATNEFHSFNKADGIPENCAARLFREDAGGNLYIGCSEEHILFFRQGKFTAYHSENLPEGWWLADILIDHRGVLWAATPTKGLLRIENLASGNPVEKAYTTADGLSSIHTQFLAEDLTGKIYFVTSRGMDVLEPETGRVKQYTSADGLASAGTGSAIRARSGDIWLGVHRGISRFTPEADKPLIPPPIFIGNLRIAGKLVSLSALGEKTITELTLEPDQRNVQIDFFGLNLTSGDALRYQYKLEGTDTDWSDLSAQRSVNLNLSPGKYKFIVRAVTLEGAKSELPASVSFSVLRPAWQRWWFLTLAAIVFASFIYALYRYRLNQLLKLEKVRVRIATDLHDDIGSSLSQIAILSEVARRRVGAGGGDKLDESLNMIADTSREMVDSMSDIVWAINPDKDHLSDLIHRMRRFASDILDAKDVAYSFRFDESYGSIALSADIRREVYLIFKEAINNLVKYAEAGVVEMSVRIENHSLVLQVKDDGCGFDLSADPNESHGEGLGGNGLINMRRRAESLGGFFEIESVKAGGTSVTIKIPVK